MTEPIPSKNSSDECQQLIAGYVLYDLSQEESVMLEQWMAEDPAIAQAIEQEMERMQKVLELTHAPAEVQPPAHLRNAVLMSHQADISVTDNREESQREAVAQLTSAQFSREQQGKVQAEPVTSPSVIPAKSPVLSSTSTPLDYQSRQFRRWQRSLGAIIAALITGLSISNVVLWRSLQMARVQLEDSTPTVARTVALNSTDADTTTNAPSVLVQIDATDLQATLDAENLPPLPDGQVYVLWTVLQPDAPFTTDDKGAILTQTFTVDGQGKSSTQIVLPPVYQDLEWVKAIAITVEAAEAPQRHEASPLLIETL